MRIAGFDAADLVGGLLVFAGGCAVALGATSYQIGELTRMGPGYFPMVVGTALAVIGLGLVFVSRTTATTVPALRLRPAFAVFAGLIFWALTIERFGLVPSTLGLVDSRVARPGPAASRHDRGHGRLSDRLLHRRVHLRARHPHPGDQALVMDFGSNIALGFTTALQPFNLAIVAFGVTLGTLAGVLPGVGAITAISILLPLTFYMDPTSALIMLAGIYYGAQYGGSTTSILMNIPGTSTHAVTCLDGYPLSKQGRAGPAMFIAGVTSFVGGSFAILLMMFLAPPIAEIALKFQSAEYVNVMVFGLVAASTLSAGSPLKGLAMVTFGVVLGVVGIDLTSGVYRFNFGFLELSDGLNLVAVAMGLFGVAEILVNLMKGASAPFTIQSVKLRALLPTWERHPPSRACRRHVRRSSAPAAASCRASARRSRPSWPMRPRSASRSIPSASAGVRSRASPRRRRRTTPRPRPPSFRPSVSAFRAMRSAPSCSAR